MVDLYGEKPVRVYDRYAARNDQDAGFFCRSDTLCERCIQCCIGNKALVSLAPTFANLEHLFAAVDEFWLCLIVTVQSRTDQRSRRLDRPDACQAQR